MDSKLIVPDPQDRGVEAFLILTRKNREKSVEILHLAKKNL
jgi:hypothetical protein